MLELSAGEAWWLMRRRLGITMASMAEQLHLAPAQYRRWERDRGGADVPRPVDRLPRAGRHVLFDWPLAAPEFVALQRRRRGWSQNRLALEASCSRQTVLMAEEGRTGGVRRLVRFWRILGVLPSDRACGLAVRTDGVLTAWLAEADASPEMDRTERVFSGPKSGENLI